MQRSSLQEFHKEVTQRLSKLTARSHGRQVDRKDYQKGDSIEGKHECGSYTFLPLSLSCEAGK